MLTEYQIEYHTHNVYESPVSEAIFEFLVAPCSNETQEVTQLRFRNSLHEEMYSHTNVFGFNISSIRTVKSFTRFECWMEATVIKQQSLLPFPQLSVEEELSLLASTEFYVDHHLFLENTRYTTIDEADAGKIWLRRAGQATVEYLKELTQYVYQLLKFDADTTDVHTTASEVIHLGKGVCQDYTHLFLAMARANRIPCRYVSGYLNQGVTLVGSAVMHAWAEAFVPGSGWFGFDPTNNLLADVNHIKAAHGVDYTDCSPIKGILKTSGDNTTDYQVKVIPNVVAAAQQ